jgi:hypothetical protein
MPAHRFARRKPHGQNRARERTGRYKRAADIALQFPSASAGRWSTTRRHPASVSRTAHAHFDSPEEGTERGERRTRRRDPPAQPSLSADAARPRVRGLLPMAERKRVVQMRVRKVLGRVFLQTHCARVRGPSRFPRIRIQRRAPFKYRARRLSALQALQHGAYCAPSTDAPVLLRSACRRPRATSPRLIDLLLVSTRRAAQAPYIITTCQ